MNFNSKKYGELLAEVLPKKISTEEENERILKIIEGFMSRGEENLSLEEDTLFALLVDLVEDFEEIAYPITKEPMHILKFLLKERNLTTNDLLPFFESEEIVSEILNGNRGIGKKTAKELGKFFSVPSYLFVE